MFSGGQLHVRRLRGGSAPRAAAMAPAAGGHSAARRGAALTDLPSSQSIIYTASLTVRGRQPDPGRRRGHPAGPGRRRLCVRGEHRARPGPPGPVHGQRPAQDPGGHRYQRVLGALSGLGTRQAESQHAQDVTQTVADVTSRVASAQAAIAQLRKLLARAGSVSSLLDVQNQINTEEASLEALQAQQRALAHETTYATISLLLTAKPVLAVQKNRSAGFLRGLAAGWHGLVRVVVALLTAAGSAAVRGDPGRGQLPGLARAALAAPAPGRGQRDRAGQPRLGRGRMSPLPGWLAGGHLVHQVGQPGQHVGLVSGSTPCPRLNTWPSAVRPRPITSRARRSITSHGASRMAGSRLPCSAVPGSTRRTRCSQLSVSSDLVFNLQPRAWEQPVFLRQG